MTEDLFAPGFKAAPYWWDQVPRPAIAEAPLPASVDVAIIGSGYTGLHAAIQTARGGRGTLVIDAEDAGWGCSTRNGGQISTCIKPDFETLSGRHGPEAAAAILREGQNSLAFVGDFITKEKIDCDFGVVGRYHAAHNPAQYEALARRVANQPKGLEVPVHMVPRAEQHTEIATDAYFGGAIYEAHASVHPARYHQGLLERAQGAGAQVVARCPALGIEREGGRFIVATPKGKVSARDVVVATNGYTGTLTPWLRRRVIPIGSYMIATEPLPVSVIDRLIPKDRIVSDTRKVVVYYRASPDRTRILYGGRVSVAETDPRISGPKLHALLAHVFPDLKDTKISHSWCGFVAYTFDELMHIGQREGIHYAMGYCGSGVGMASYLGMRIGQQVLGRPEGRTAFDGIRFQTRPLYTGKPWFLAPSVMYYRWRDSRPI